MTSSLSSMTPFETTMSAPFVALRLESNAWTRRINRAARTASEGKDRAAGRSNEQRRQQRSSVRSRSRQRSGREIWRARRQSATWSRSGTGSTKTSGGFLSIPIAMSFCTLYRSALVPRIIPAIGLVGAPLILVAGAATLVGANEQVSVWTAIATLPIFAWELSLGLWLTAKGFTPTVSTPR